MNTIEQLTSQITFEPQNTELYLQRGELNYKQGNFGAAINDFNKVLAIDPSHTAAQEHKTMVQTILEFRYVDVYNP